jgi:hypothetical protein
MMANLLHSVITFKVAHQWCFEVNSFNPASKYILIKTSKTFFKIQKITDFVLIVGGARVTTI